MFIAKLLKSNALTMNALKEKSILLFIIMKLTQMKKELWNII